MAVVAAVRDAVGPGVRIALDAHGRFGLLGALRVVQALAPHDVYFLEEPLHPGDAPALGELARRSAIPLALGERLYSRWDYRPVLEGRYVSLLQPDIIHVGGIAELHKIGAMADAYSVGIAAHNAAGPISTAATLQVVACMPNVQIQEMFAPGGAPWKDDLAVTADTHRGRERCRSPLVPAWELSSTRRSLAAHPARPRSLGFYGEESMLELPRRENLS